MRESKGAWPIRKTEMWTLKRVQCWCGSCSGWTASQCTSRQRKRKKKGERERERGRKNRQEPVLSRGRALIQKQGAQGNNKKSEMGWGRRGKKTFKTTTKHYWFSRADSGWMPALNVISESDKNIYKARHMRIDGCMERIVGSQFL